MSTQLMKEVHDAFATAVEHHQNGRSLEAEELYRTVVDALPDFAPALNNLSMLVPREEAVALLRRAVAAEPNYVDALINLSGALYTEDDLRGADVFFQRALALIPEDADDLFRLGRILQGQGRTADAILQYERAVALNPGLTGALCNLAALHSEARRQAEAADCLRRALRADPASDVLNHNLVIVLRQDGRLQEAASCAKHLLRPQPLNIEEAPTPRRTVLLPGTLVGNVPLDLLLPQQTNTRIQWSVEFATDEQERALPAYDVCFNAIGNADVIDPAVDRLEALHQRRPMLNHPAAIAQTRRDRLPALLADLPGVVAPAVLRVERGQLAGSDMPARLDAAGIGFPVLVRPIVGHGGDGMVLAHSPAELASGRFGDADAHYLIAYHDYQSSDGYFRKYRAVFIDGRIYAYHLAISEKWLVHYFSADMLAAPWKREEERRFLEQPEQVLGKEALAAITAIDRRLGLDYAGIDFAMLPDGRVLVFEANATMLVHLNDDPALFPYKHVHVPVIREAFAAMLDRHAQAWHAQARPRVSRLPRVSVEG